MMVTKEIDRDDGSGGKELGEEMKDDENEMQSLR